MPSSGPVITADAVMSRLRLRCFSLIFSFVSPCVQLSDSGPKRSKREVLGDGSTQPYPETQQSITLLSPRKETHLLVSEEGFTGTRKASRAKSGQISYSCANGPTARVAKEPKNQLLLLDATLTSFFILPNSTFVFYEENQKTNCYHSPCLHTSRF